MAFRLPSQRKFKPNTKVVPRKASIPASLARQPSSSTPGPSSTPSRHSTQLPHTDNTDSPAPENASQDAGLPPGVGSTEGIPTVGSSQPAPVVITQPSRVFREPSLPPASRKRAASPTPSSASKSSRTGGRPTMIHLAASSGPARRSTVSPSPAPQPAAVQEISVSAEGEAPPATLPRVSPSMQRNAPAPKLSAPRPPSRPSASPSMATPAKRTPSVQPSQVPSTSQAPAPARAPSANPDRAPSESSGMPPMIGYSNIDPKLLDQTPGAGPSREETAELARVLVAGIALQPAPPKRQRLTKMGTVPRKTGPPKGRTRKDPNAPPLSRKKKKDASVASESAGQAEEGEATTAADAEEGQDQPSTQKKRRPYRRKPPELDEDGNKIRKPRPPYGSKGLAGTDKDGRLRHNRESKLAKAAGFDDDEIDEFAEDIPIDPNQQTMGTFARKFYDGDMTERATKLKEAQKQKREDAQRERIEFERIKHIRLQPLRRRERATRNEARARRREEAKTAGKADDDEVSEDEINSTDEEYEFEPDRLTPPGTPEPENFDEEAAGEGMGEGQGEEEQEGLGDVTEYPEDGDEEVDPEEQDEEDVPRQDVDLGDYGFNVAEDTGDGDEGEAPPRDPNEAEPDFSALLDINPDEGEVEYDDDGQPTYSFADYTANMEARRAAALANTNSRFVYTEDDDETRMINSTSWQKREKTDKWTDDETDFFYSVLGEVGENYGLMKAFFPGRSIAQIKRKGLRENAKHPEKVTQAILARRPIDNRYLQKSAGYDPDRPWDAEEALFAEAKRDMEKLRAEDRGEEYLDNAIGEPDLGDDHAGVGDETMDIEVNGDDQEEQVDEAAAEPEAEAREDGNDARKDNGEQNHEDGALFLPGPEDDHGSP